MAYTYLIGWKKYNKYYYGVRFSKKSDPSELWISYFTSSKHVKDFYSLHGEPDLIEIRKTFDDSDKAILWESKVLKKMKVLHDDKWLNQNIAGAINKEYCALGGKYHIGLKKPKQSLNMSGINNPMYGKKRPDNAIRNKKIAKSNIGKIWFNDGIRNKRCFETDAPCDWNKGMIMKKENHFG